MQEICHPDAEAVEKEQGYVTDAFQGCYAIKHTSQRGLHPVVESQFPSEDIRADERA